MKRKIYLNMFLVLFFLIAGCYNQKKDWQESKRLGTLEAYETFLKKYSHGQFVDSARQKIEKIEWQSIVDLDSVKMFDAFLQKYPHGNFTDSARQKIEKIEWQSIVDLDSVKIFETFLQKYPHSNFTDSARQKIEEIDLKKTINLGTVEAYEIFLQKYPKGEISDKARLNRDIMKIIITKIDPFFIYEGSEVLIIYDPSGELIQLKYLNRKWQVLKSEVREVTIGQVMIVGTVKAGTRIPFGARAGEGTLEYDLQGFPRAGEGGLTIAIKKKL